MNASLDMSVHVGEVLASKYRVERVLGAGGMGVVVAATHLQLGQLVALKFIRCEALPKPEAIARFEREVRAAARLRSDHAARVIDVGQLDDGSPYIVMEYLEGEDLAAVLQRHGTISAPLACGFVIQACDAIAEAHSLGIVHRDLKPGNLFLAHATHGRQTIKVLDFGISKSFVAPGELRMTRTQDIMGSPGYMSPEQMRSARTVDGRSDIWSLGIILYELITGQVPFEADTLTALCLKIAMEPPPPLPPLPVPRAPELAEVVHRALQKDPALRHQSAAELACALAPFADAESRALAEHLASSTAGTLSGSRTMPAKQVVTTLNVATGQRHDRAVRHGRSRRYWFAGVAIGAAAAVGGAIGLTCGSRGIRTGMSSPFGDSPSEARSETPRPTSQPGEPATPTIAETTPDAMPDATSVVTASAPAGEPALSNPSPIDAGIEKPVKPNKPMAPSRPRNRERGRSRNTIKPTDTVDPFSSPD